MSLGFWPSPKPIHRAADEFGKFGKPYEAQVESSRKAGDRKKKLTDICNRLKAKAEAAKAK